MICVKLFQLDPDLSYLSIIEILRFQWIHGHGAAAIDAQQVIPCRE